jgi:hypothetical protein
VKTVCGPLLIFFAASLLVPSLAADGAARAAQEGKAQGCELLTQSRKFDEYGDLSAAEEKSRAEKLAAALAAEHEDTVAFIIGYAGREGGAGAGLARADRVKQALVEKSFFSNSRFNTLDCGWREAPATEFWLTPAGASPPRCAPTLDPTLAPAKGAARRPSPRRGTGRL